MKKDIIDAFPVSPEEYRELDEKFGKLCYFVAHGLRRKNSRNNITDEIEDIYQDLQIYMLHAGSYYKRQVYIVRCFSKLREFVPAGFVETILNELENLWDNRTRHGANRQKFGPFQEEMLEKLVQQFVPDDVRPRRDARLKMDRKFAVYCKAIIWNGQKAMGKKITREKSVRNGQVSLSEFSYLGA